MRKLKILFQSPTYLPVLGGIQTSTHNLAKYFIKQGHDVSVFCEQSSLDFPFFEIIDKVKIYRFPYSSLNKFLKSLSFIYKQQRVYKYSEPFFKEHDFDIIISRFYFYVPTTKKLTNTPIIFLQPSIGYIALLKSAENSHGLLDKFNQYIRAFTSYFIEKKAVQQSDSVFSRSKAMNSINRNIFRRKGKMNIFGAGANHKRFKPRQPKKSLIQKYKLKNKKVILTVSRLTPDKNNKGLIRIFSKIKTKDTVLMIVGGGKEKPQLEKLARKLGVYNSVIFVGERKDPEFFYNLADVFVLISKQEGFGNVFIEALASGVPIIGYKAQPPKIVTATEDIISNKKVGFAAKDESEIAEKIDYLLENPKIRKQFAKNAHKHSFKFIWKNCAEDILADIKRILKIK